jgi:hypothetical protein
MITVSKSHMDIITQVSESAKELVTLADEGDAHCQDDECRVLFGVVRDCAYKILTEIQREIDSGASR